MRYVLLFFFSFEGRVLSVLRTHMEESVMGEGALLTAVLEQVDIGDRRRNCGLGMG